MANTSRVAERPWRPGLGVLLVGIIGSLVLPQFTLEPHAPLPPAETPPSVRPAPEPLRAPPALESVPHFERALEVGAETSGAHLQDSDGFLWFGTYGGGLYRYDGESLKRYSSSTGHLSGSNVTSLYEDASRNLWIATLRGIDRYDRAHDRFEPITLVDEVGRPMPREGAWTLLGDGQTLWVGTNGAGLLRVALPTLRTKRFVHDPGNARSLPHDSVYALKRTRTGQLLLGTFGGGAALFDPGRGETTLHLGINSGLASDQVWAVHEHESGELWVGTQQGLDRLSATGTPIQHFDYAPGEGSTLGGPVVSGIREDVRGRLWVTAFNGDSGLSRVDPGDNSVMRAQLATSMGHETPHTGARTVFEDASGLFWVLGMHQLYTYDPHSLGIDLVSIGSGLLPIYEDRSGLMWLGTVDGLRRFDRTTGTSTAVTAPELANALVTAFAEDVDANFWLAPYGGDLLRYNRGKDRVEARFSHDPANADSLPSSNTIRAILPDQRAPNVLWLLTQGGGLCRFAVPEQRCQRFAHERDNPRSLDNDTASYGAILQDAVGNLWVGTDAGLNYLRVDEGRFERVPMRVDDEASKSPMVVQALHMREGGELWVGTSDGLYRRDPISKTFTRFSVNDGLADNMVLSVLEEDGELWISTPMGLTVFDPSGQAPPRVHLGPNSLRGNTFLMTSALKTSDGDFWFGGEGGLNHLRPADLSTNSYVPPVVFTGFHSGESHLAPAEDAAQLREITLTYPENHFWFEAAALSFSRPELNRFRYRLVGIDHDWVVSEHGKGRYSALPPGQYTLQLQAANSAGVWNTAGKSVRVTVQGPLYARTWFITGVLLLCTLIAAAVVWYVERLSSEVRHRRQAERGRALAEARMREATKLEALGRLSAGVAHDFNNLLTVVLGEAAVARETFREVQGTPLEHALLVIESAAMRGAELTRQLLAFSGRREGQLRPTNLNALIPEAQRFFERVLGSDVHFTYTPDPTLPVVLADAGQVHQILMNLVINARHAMPEGGELTLRTTTLHSDGSGDVPAGDYAGFLVRDTGAGMSPETQARMFDPFFTTKRSGEGTGLGLATVKEIVERHGGTIQVESEPGVGTQFAIYFPVAKADATASRTSRTTLRPHVKHGTRVLLVEDDAQVRDTLCSALRHEGFEVIAVGSSEAAIDELEHRFGSLAALVTDVMLPDDPSGRLVEEARALRPDLPILVLSGYTQSQLKLDLPGTGKFARLDKPITPTDLLDTLSKLVVTAPKSPHRSQTRT